MLADVLILVLLGPLLVAAAAVHELVGWVILRVGGGETE